MAKIETDISPDYPFEPHYQEVLGSRMHYVDVGSGDPILILHGNPTWSYLWRNIIPHLEPLGRCIAPDLIGYGRSDKPGIEYHWFEHVKYLEAFIEKLGLKNVTLVLHDQGSALGFHYASRHESNVKALAFFEAIIRPFPWDQFSSPEYRELFRQFRTGGPGGVGWQMIVEQNMFINELLPQASGRPLSDKEMAYYREPFIEPMSRIPIWRFPRETAIGGEPEDVWQAVTAYSDWLQKTNLPKYLLYASPGALITAENLQWAQQNIQGLETFDLGEGAHFLQESSPGLIGREVARWIKNLPANASAQAPEASGAPAADPSASAAPPAPTASKGSTPSARTLQHLIDEAAHFNVFSVPDSADSTAINGTGGVIGFNIDEVLHRFVVDTQAPKPGTPTLSSNSVGEPIGKFSHRWLLIPDDFVATPDKEPPPVPLDPTRSQRFVMLDSKCTFGEDGDGFHGFGSGSTMPTMVNGQQQLLCTAVGTVLEGFGRFQGYEYGTYVYCGSLDPDGGFTGNILMRVMDPKGKIQTQRSLPALRHQPGPEPGVTYAILRGEAVPDDPVSPYISPEGKPIGLIVEQGLRLLFLDSSSSGRLGVATTDRVGQLVGRITAYVTFDPASAAGTALDPIPFTVYDEFVLYGSDGEVVGSFTADTSDGRVFNLTIGGQPGIRFGGVGRILSGAGPYEGIEGLMTDNSVVVFEPHVSASVYILRINDPDGAFLKTLRRS